MAWCRCIDGSGSEEQLIALIARTATKIKSSTTVIGPYAFYNNSILTDIDFPLAEKISYNSFEGCTKLENVNLPLVKDIGDSCFNGCTSLAKAIFPLIKEIPSSCFYNCSKIVDTSFPLVENCKSNSFSGCYALTKLEFPSLKKLDRKAFNNCTNLNVLILRSKMFCCTLTNIDAFTNTPFASGKAGGTLYVPREMVRNYQYSSNWSTILGYSNNQILPIEGSIYE
jgi:hypothetical protein